MPCEKNNIAGPNNKEQNDDDHHHRQMLPDDHHDHRQWPKRNPKNKKTAGNVHKNLPKQPTNIQPYTQKNKVVKYTAKFITFLGFNVIHKMLWFFFFFCISGQNP